jgi:hypothetical protein
MGQYRLVHIDEDGSKIVHVFNDMADLDEMCRRFTYFLRANSFIFDDMAEVGIIYPEDKE